MQAFHNDLKIKKKYIARVQAHRKADELIQGVTWKKGKGCAVGCTLEAYSHARYETELGIPEWLARVEDTLFEGMSKEEAMLWPEKFLSAIPVGADLEPVKRKFIVVVLKHTLVSMKKVKFNRKTFPEVAKVIEGSQDAVKLMIKAQQSGDVGLIKTADSAAHEYYAAELLKTSVQSKEQNPLRCPPSL